MGEELEARMRLLRTIACSIAEHGFHRYAMRGGLSPDFSYTFGLTDSVGYELATVKELWRLNVGGDIPEPTPIVAHGQVYQTSAHGRY